MLQLTYLILKGVIEIKQFDLIIIGAGPAGLYAADYASLQDLNILLLDSLDQIGGQPQMLYPFKAIRDLPAYAQITAQKLIDKLIANLGPKTKVKTNHKVEEIASDNDGFIVDQKFFAKSIIIATGIGAFHPKKFPLRASKEAEARINYLVKKPADFAKEKIGVFGGGDSALDWSLELAARAQKVTLIHRRNAFRGLESTLSSLKKLKNVEVLTPYLPKTISLQDNVLQLSLKKVGDPNHIEKRQFDQIIVAYGLRANNHFVKNWGVQLAEGRIKVDSKMQTNVPHIYAIGDAVGYPGRVPLIGIGFGEAQIAINTIMRDLFPQKNLSLH